MALKVGQWYLSAQKQFYKVMEVLPETVRYAEIIQRRDFGKVAAVRITSRIQWEVDVKNQQLRLLANAPDEVAEAPHAKKGRKER